MWMINYKLFEHTKAQNKYQHESFLSMENNKHRSWNEKEAKDRTKLECGPMPNVMVALPNIGGTLCSTMQSLADAHYQNAVQ